MSSGDIEQITSVEGQYSSPTYSPDGKWIAYFGHLQEAGPGSFSKLYCMPATGGQPQLISQDFDYAVGNSVGSDMTSASELNPVWSLDQEYIYFIATTGGVCRLFKVASSGGTPIPLTPEDKVVFGYSFHLESDRVAIVYNEPANMGDLYGLNLSAGDRRALNGGE